jgi:hypothetical protein
VAARFEIHIYSRALRTGAGFFESPHFGMLHIIITMIAFAYDHTISYDNRTDERVRTHQRSALRRKLKCEL